MRQSLRRQLQTRVGNYAAAVVLNIGLVTSLPTPSVPVDSALFVLVHRRTLVDGTWDQAEVTEGALGQRMILTQPLAMQLGCPASENSPN